VKTVPLTDAKNRLSALVEEAHDEHEIIRITRHGRAGAVLISEDDLESLRETVFWLSQPQVREDIAEACQAATEGRLIDADEVRRRFGLRPL
jgi:prevent-host-death family protein